MEHINELRGWAQTKAIARLAWPAVFGMLSQNLLNIVDAKMVGGLGPAALAAQSVSSITVFVFVGFLGALSVGCQTIVARRLGQKRPEMCGAALDHTLVIALAVGMCLVLPCYFLTPAIQQVMASDEVVRTLGIPYMRWRYMGVLFFVFMVAYRGFFNGIGETWVYMVVAWIVNLFNILANYCLIYGRLGFPAMGLEGAGLGTALSNMAGAAAFTYFALKPEIRERFASLRFREMDWHMSKTIARLSFPTGIEGGMIVGSFAVFSRIMGMVGTAHQAACGITMAFFAFVFLPAVGLGQAGAAIVGQQIGSGRQDAIDGTVDQLLRLCFVLNLFIGVTFASSGASLFRFFTDDPLVVELGRGTLAALGIFAIVDALTLVYAHVLQSGGETAYVMRAHVGTNLAIFMPFAYLLSFIFELGSMGGFLAFGVYVSAYLAMLVYRYQRDDWKTRKL